MAFALIDGDGWHGDTVRIYSTYDDLRSAQGAALRAGRQFRLIAGCHLPAGSVLPSASLSDLLAVGDWRVVRAEAGR